MDEVRREKASCKGQSMVEIAVCLPIIVLIFTGILFFGRGFVMGQRAGMAARYSSWYFARHKNAQESSVKQTVKQVFELDYTVKNGKTSLGGGFGNVLSFISGAGSARKTAVSIPYKPNYLAFNPESINIGHAVVVDSGTWTYEETGSDNLLGIIVEQFFGAIKKFISPGGGGSTTPPDSNSPSEQGEPSGTPDL